MDLLGSILGSMDAPTCTPVDEATKKKIKGLSIMSYFLNSDICFYVEVITCMRLRINGDLY